MYSPHLYGQQFPTHFLMSLTVCVIFKIANKIGQIFTKYSFPVSKTLIVLCFRLATDMSKPYLWLGLAIIFFSTALRSILSIPIGEDHNIRVGIHINHVSISEGKYSNLQNQFDDSTLNAPGPKQTKTKEIYRNLQKEQETFGKSNKSM